MEWLLIAWVGTVLTGGPTMERFATEAECTAMAKTLAEVAGLRQSEEVFRWRCVEVQPLLK